MAEVGRVLWRSSCPTFLFRQGRLEQVAQDRVLASKPGTFASDVFTYISELFWERGFAPVVSPQSMGAECCRVFS